MEVSLQLDGASYVVKLTKHGERYHASLGEREFEVYSHRLTDVSRVLTREGRLRTVYLTHISGTYHVWVDGHTFTIRPARGAALERRTASKSLRHDGPVSAPMPGKLTKLLVRVGQRVQAGQRLAVVEAMKMEHDICAPTDGTVRRINFAENSLVDPSHPLLELAVDSTAATD